MAVIFTQSEFGGGLNTRLEASKLPANEYPLLFNGRIVANTIQPVKNHLLLDCPVGTTRQGLYAIGKLLILFSDGGVYWKDTSSATSPWSTIPGWTAMNATAARIYAEPIPVNYFLGGIEYTDDRSDTKLTWPGVTAATESYLFVTDGVTSPRVILPNNTYRVLNTDHAIWSKTVPEYVPAKCILPRKSGGKLYVVDAEKKNIIYHSVSGRFTDFIIDRNASGDYGGDETSVQKSVDYNDVTSLAAVSDPNVSIGSLFVGTLFGSYIITPNYDSTIFGEPSLPDRNLFPTGPVNDKSFADLNGDTAFITQTGIQSFNVTQQFRMESNNFPLGAKIAKILVNPQSGTCATNYDTYALFSVNTVYGKVVLVYDNILQSFVSIDLGFGEVTDFAVTKYEGTQKLFFLTKDGNVYQAYGDTEYSVCRIYLGEYATYDAATGSQTPGKQSIIDKIRFQFSEVKEDTNVQLSLYMDRKLIKTESRTIAASPYPENVPYPLPFSSHRQSYPVDFAILDKPRGWKTGLLLEWNSGAELLAVACEGDIVEPESLNVTGVSDSPLKTIAIFNDNVFGSNLTPDSTVSGWANYIGLTKGAWYSVVGTCNTGNRTVTNAIFQAPGTEVSVLAGGTICPCEEIKTIWDLIDDDDVDQVIGAGDHAMSSGTANDVTRILSVVDIDSIEWAPGNHDQDTGAGLFFFQAKPSERYYKVTVGTVDFFLLNLVTADPTDVTNDTPVDPDGISETSVQALWLKAQLAASTNTFKVIVCHQPPYTDVAVYYPGYAVLRWPFKTWGADLVISAHSHVYERFVIDDLTYIVNGPSGSDTRLFKSGVNRSVFRIGSPDNAEGYLRLTADNFKVLGEFIGMDGLTKDAFSINA